MWVVVGTVVIVLPLLIDPLGKDIFRLPKELLFRAQAVVILTTAAMAAIVGRMHFRRGILRDRLVVLSVLIVVWTLVVTVCSTNPLLSLSSLEWVLAGVVFTLTVYFISPRVSLRRVDLLFVAALPNCCLYLLQESRIWNPFFTEEYIAHANANRHLFSTGLLGNPDDLASYLLIPALSAAVLTRIAPGRSSRFTYLCLAALIGITVVISQSWAAIGAYVVGVALLVILTTRRPTIWIAIMLVGLIAIITTYAPFRTRLVNVIAELQRNEMNAYSVDLILSNRLVPFVAAVQMTRDHPLTGVGPRCFGWQYYRYKVMFENDHLDLKRSSGTWWNFGEVHNDHLQTLAVAGVPGYVLFCAALILIGSGSRGIRGAVRQRRLSYDRRSFSLLLSLPLAVSFGVLTLALFPLELAAPTVVMAFASALCVSWRSNGEERR